MAGRPKGSYTRPQIKDYLTKENIVELTNKAKEKALEGDPIMLKFLLEQVYGKAPMVVEDPGGDKFDVIPIYAGISRHKSDAEDIPTKKEDKSSNGGNVSQ